MNQHAHRIVSAAIRRDKAFSGALRVPLKILLTVRKLQWQLLLFHGMENVTLEFVQNNASANKKDICKVQEPHYREGGTSLLTD